MTTAQNRTWILIWSYGEKEWNRLSYSNWNIILKGDDGSSIPRDLSKFTWTYFITVCDTALKKQVHT